MGREDSHACDSGSASESSDEMFSSLMLVELRTVIEGDFCSADFRS